MQTYQLKQYNFENLQEAISFNNDEDFFKFFSKQWKTIDKNKIKEELMKDRQISIKNVMNELEKGFKNNKVSGLTILKGTYQNNLNKSNLNPENIYLESQNKIYDDNDDEEGNDKSQLLQPLSNRKYNKVIKSFKKKYEEHLINITEIYKRTKKNYKGGNNEFFDEERETKQLKELENLHQHQRFLFYQNEKKKNSIRKSYNEKGNLLCCSYSCKCKNCQKYINFIYPNYKKKFFENEKPLKSISKCENNIYLIEKQNNIIKNILEDYEDQSSGYERNTTLYESEFEEILE